MANRCKIVLQNYLKTLDIDLYSDYKIVNYIIYYKNKLFFVFCSNNTILKYDNAGECIIKDCRSPDYQYYYNNKYNLIQYYNKNNINYKIIQVILLFKHIKYTTWKYYNYLYNIYKKMIIINMNQLIQIKYYYSKIKYSIIIHKFYSNIYLHNIKYVNTYSTIFLFIFDIII